MTPNMAILAGSSIQDHRSAVLTEGVKGDGVVCSKELMNSFSWSELTSVYPGELPFTESTDSFSMVSTTLFTPSDIVATTGVESLVGVESVG